MTAPLTALTGAVELLDRSLAYTRVALAAVRPDHVALPTPCRGWSVGRLLAHMDDGLDAFTEAATGRVELAPTAEAPVLDAIRDKACALLGWWLEQPADPVAIGDRLLGGPVLVSAAALEITVHGWDLRQAVGAAADVPEPLASPLMTTAVCLAASGGLPDCFSPAAALRPGSSASDRLLAYVGRG